MIRAGKTDAVLRTGGTRGKNSRSRGDGWKNTITKARPHSVSETDQLASLWYFDFQHEFLKQGRQAFSAGRSAKGSGPTTLKCRVPCLRRVSMPHASASMTPKIHNLAAHDIDAQSVQSVMPWHDGLRRMIVDAATSPCGSHHSPAASNCFDQLAKLVTHRPYLAASMRGLD